MWGCAGRGSLAREIAPFWFFSLAGLVASTGAVSFVSAASAHWSTSARAIALPVANLSVFGALWLVQFALLDRILFKPAPKEYVS